MPKIIKIC